MSRMIWVASKANGWEIGEVVDEDSSHLNVRCSGEVRKVNKADTFRSDLTHFADLDDLCRMAYLHEAPLLDSLRRRFANDHIYTTAGDILLSVNPYKTIAGMYDSPLQYLDLPEDGEIDSSTSSPHVYKVANFTLLQMMYGKKLPNDSTATSSNQSVVVSGESGAGKTEASKLVMNFLIAADSEIVGCKSGSQDKLGETIKQVLMKSNIIFEAFGNAKTVRNDNSSRFGKYIKLQYSEQHRIVSAFTETFLLEKSRLVNIGAKERNYHVFYQIIDGIDNDMKNKLHLHAPNRFKMLTDTEGNATAAPQDSQFSELQTALETIGCSAQELEHLWSLLGSLLHLGNLECKERPESVSSGEPAGLEGNLVIESPLISLDTLADFLGVSGQLFRTRMTTQRVKVSSRRSVTVKLLSSADANNNAAALVKWMYSCIFSWLLQKVNYAHCHVNEDNVRAEKFIGILDIFGFEILETNSFEQLCINFTNERLQQQFNEYVFDREQNMYQAEGLDWTAISYKDNQHVIDLIGKKPTGLLPMLEAQGMLNRGSSDEAALVSSFNQAHDKKSPAYEKSRFLDLRFTVKHFAGDVTYTVNGFLDKNNDALQEDLLELMMCSANPFIRNAVVAVGLGEEGTPGELGTVPPMDPSKVVTTAIGHLSMSRDASKKIGGSAAAAPSSGPGKKLASSVTVSYQFRSQLDVLISSLRATSPHYIKCIKPNSRKSAGIFDGALVLEQLRYSGALEVVRIRQEGYPVCLPFIQFYEIFEQLAFKRNWTPAHKCTAEEAKLYVTTLCSEALQRITDFQIGTTKLFMKSESYEKMYSAVESFLSRKVRKFQALARQVVARKRFLKTVRRMILVQSCVRMFLARRTFRVILKEYRAKLERERLQREEEERRMEAERQKEESERQRILEEQRRLEQIRREEEEKRKALELQARLELEQRAIKVHDAVLAGDQVTVEALFRANASDRTLLDHRRHNCSLVQSAVVGGNLDMLKHLQPTAAEIWHRDSRGNSALQYALEFMRPQVEEMLRYLLFVGCGEFDNSSLPHEADASTDKDTADEHQSKELKSGWLHKRGESNLWRKRWVRLTTDALMYFRNSKDSIPRDTLSFTTKNDLRIERSTAKATAIDIFIGHHSALKNRSRVSLMADTEQDVQIWMNLIKAAAGVESSALRKTGTPVYALNESYRRRVFAQVNLAGDNLLHTLCRTVAAAESGASDIPSYALAVAGWLIQHGCSVHTFNSNGLNPLQLACELRLERLATLFASHGADPAERTNGGRGAHTSLTISRSHGFELQLVKAYDEFFRSSKQAERFLSRPPMLRGFHYLSIYCGCSEVLQRKDHFEGAASGLTLRAEAFTRTGSILESAQLTKLKFMDVQADRQKLFWLDTVYLHFPLEGIEDLAFIQFDIVGDKGIVATTRFVIEKLHVQSGPLILPFTDKDAEVPHSVLQVDLTVSTRLKA